MSLQPHINWHFLLQGSINLYHEVN
jgi:hypothetical protein